MPSREGGRRQKPPSRSGSDRAVLGAPAAAGAARGYWLDRGTNTDGRRLDAHPTAADPHSGKRAVGAHAPQPVAQIITEADGTSAWVAKKARTHHESAPTSEEFALREADAVRGLLLIAALR